MSLPHLTLNRVLTECASVCASPAAVAATPEVDYDEELLPQTKSLDDEFCLLHDAVHEVFTRLDVLLQKLQARATA